MEDGEVHGNPDYGERQAAANLPAACRFAERSRLRIRKNAQKDG